ncbi:MAG: hypothetical protein KME16_04475 [Scytolyngbya sp. HA4215-MV1]|jgi:oligosaccharide repeat unit polymerase|nr:hypothetical protein [Scytolyngbya sp. HA4215-MV1]
MAYETGLTIAFPFNYVLAGIILGVLSLEAFLRRNRAWGIPSLIIYATTALWYFVEIFYTPEEYTSFPNSIIEDSYTEVIIFLISYRLMISYCTKRLVNRRLNMATYISQFTFNPNRFLVYIASVWLILLLFGLSRVNWNLVEALFPLTGRAGINMWSRAGAGAAGAGGFIISSANYIYTLTCAFFGILLFFTRNQIKILNLALILASWPFYMLSGTRNQFLAVAMPAFFTYLLLSKQKWWMKILVSLLLFGMLNYLFTIVIAYRDVGFQSVVSNLMQGQEINKPETKHLGLNMAVELFYINQFYDQGQVQLQYGFDYLADFLNFIPRAIWPEKPILGLQYNLLRGFGSSRGDIGVFATIASGFIGRGVLNFGPWLGPIAPALLLALWSALLSRFWSQRYSVLRLCLFLMGLGITPNLGRDITLLVIWPMIFGYGLVRFLEHLDRKKQRQMSRFIPDSGSAAAIRQNFYRDLENDS